MSYSTSEGIPFFFNYGTSSVNHDIKDACLLRNFGQASSSDGNSKFSLQSKQLTVSARGVWPSSLQALLAIVTASLDRCIAR